jgi:hypothetical protein
MPAQRPETDAEPGQEQVVGLVAASRAQTGAAEQPRLGQHRHRRQPGDDREAAALPPGRPRPRGGGPGPEHAAASGEPDLEQDQRHPDGRGHPQRAQDRRQDRPQRGLAGRIGEPGRRPGRQQARAHPEGQSRGRHHDQLRRQQRRDAAP